MVKAESMRGRRRGKNVPPAERVVSVVLGAALALFGRRRWWLAAAGSALVGRGLRGVCPLYRQLVPPSGDEVETRRSITLLAPRQAVYEMWRKLDNLPRFMDDVKQVLVVDHTRSRWVVQQGGFTFCWNAIITEDIPGKRISWRTIDGSDIDHEGTVELTDAFDGKGTELHVAFRYRLPAGRFLTPPLRRLFAAWTDAQLAVELTRMRQLLETGEISTGTRRREGQAPKERFIAAGFVPAAAKR